MALALSLITSSNAILRRRDPRAALWWVGVAWVMPFVGSLLSDRQAYAYLPRSVSYLPSWAEFLLLIERAGFSRVSRQQLSGGIAQLIVAYRE